MSKIDGAVALVTGANRGVGKEYVEQLLKRGVAKVYATARNTETLQALVDKGEGRVVAVQLDVNDAEKVQQLAVDFKDVSLLINNAGIVAFEGLISATDITSARSQMETNYFAPLNAARAFAPVLAENGGGVIVNMASIVSYINFPSIGAYSASKAALHSLTQGIRAELASQGTLVVGVYPGPVDTDMTVGMDAEKASPVTVVHNVLQAVENDEVYVYPDDASSGMHAGFRADHVAVEQQTATMLPG